MYIYCLLEVENRNLKSIYVYEINLSKSSRIHEIGNSKHKKFEIKNRSKILTCKIT